MFFPTRASPLIYIRPSISCQTHSYWSGCQLNLKQPITSSQTLKPAANQENPGEHANPTQEEPRGNRTQDAILRWPHSSSGFLPIGIWWQIKSMQIQSVRTELHTNPIQRTSCTCGPHLISLTTKRRGGLLTSRGATQWVRQAGR